MSKAKTPRLITRSMYEDELNDDLLTGTLDEEKAFIDLPPPPGDPHPPKKATTLPEEKDPLLNVGKEAAKLVKKANEPDEEELNARSGPFIMLLRLMCGNIGMNLSSCFGSQPPVGCYYFRDYAPYMDNVPYTGLTKAESWLVRYSKGEFGIDKFLRGYKQGYDTDLLIAISELASVFTQIGVNNNPVKQRFSKFQTGELKRNFRFTLRSLKGEVARWLETSN